MFRKKNKKEEEKINKRFEDLKKEGEYEIERVTVFLENKKFTLQLVQENIISLSNWINDWNNISQNRETDIKLTSEELLSDLTAIENNIIKKEKFLLNLDQFLINLEEKNKKIQKIAKKIPLIASIQDIESIHTEIEKVKENVNSLQRIPDELVNNYFSSNEILKYDSIVDKRDSICKKLPVIEKNLKLRKEKLEVTERSFEISEEKKKLFNWIDTFDQRSRKYENKIEILVDQIEEIELISKLEDFQETISLFREEIDILLPPSVNTPEVKKQIQNLSSKFNDKIAIFENKLNELNKKIEDRLIQIISERRADRLIRKFLSTKRIPKRVFYELIRSEEKFTIDWLKSLPIEEPLRLQDTDTLIALSLARVQEGKQLYEYLNEVMNKFTHEEYKENNLFTETLTKFKEAESFEKK